MPPLRTLQGSGIVWGLGTDGTAANQTLPFVTLYFAVTGKMVGGEKVNRQTIGREDALIAHTRKNAFLVFQENNLGSIQPVQAGGPAGARPDYLTVPADQIRLIKTSDDNSGRSGGLRMSLKLLILLAAPACLLAQWPGLPRPPGLSRT